jgi:hypothetical protein
MMTPGPDGLECDADASVRDPDRPVPDPDGHVAVPSADVSEAPASVCPPDEFVSQGDNSVAEAGADRVKTEEDRVVPDQDRVWPDESVRESANSVLVPAIFVVSREGDHSKGDEPLCRSAEDRADSDKPVVVPYNSVASPA